MAIRLRAFDEFDGELIALCAAKTQAEEGDIYLDDNVHYALACKFARDHNSHGVDWHDEDHDRIAMQVESAAPAAAPPDTRL